MFLKKDILPHAGEIRAKWEGFRQKELWTLEVNAMLEVNRPYII